MTTDPQQPFTYIIYKRGVETVAQKSDGSKPVHDTITENPIRTALEDPGPLDNPTGIRAGPGHIQILDGIYDMSSSFLGFNLKSFTSLILGPQAVLRVPSGYAGEVFILKSIPSIPATPTTPHSPAKPLSDCIIEGGDIREIGSSPQRLWTGILLHGIEEGVLFNKIRNTTIRSAKIGIQLKATSDPNAPASRLGIDGGWVNGNLFEGLKMWDNEIFIDFMMENTYRPDTQITGIHRNRFVNIECQTGPNTQHGVKNIRHFGNSFINVNIWDISLGTPGAIISNIHQDARRTIIISGIMTGQGFSDQGIDTKIFD